MRYLRLFLGWLFSLFFALLALSMFLLANWVSALLLLLILLICLPPMTTLLRTQLDWTLGPTVRVLIVLGLLVFVVRGLPTGEATSIYRTPDVRARMMLIYEEKLKEWPVPFERTFVHTRYGAIHVIASGPEDAPPLILLHPSGVASWSWRASIAELSNHYRTYAIDLIGDAGKSEYYDLRKTVKSGLEQAELYKEITEKLGVQRAYVVGASEGGFVGSNYALYAPDRVEKLALLGPMGYQGAVGAIVRITLAQLFPLRPVQELTIRWAFSESEIVEAEMGEWFMLLLSGVYPVKVPPLPFTPSERRSLQVPVLFVFGGRDRLVGDPMSAAELVRDVPNSRVELVEAGHLMATERPEEINRLLLDFFQDP